MGQAANPVLSDVLETVITNALIIDYTGVLLLLLMLLICDHLASFRSLCLQSVSTVNMLTCAVQVL
jgi:hypothetical protein